MSAAPSRSPAVVAWIGVALLLGLAWRVSTLGIADFLDSRAPAQALLVRPAHPDALLRAAAAEADTVEAGAKARAALRRNPLDGRGYRVLSASATPPERAIALLEIAVARSPRDLPGHTLLARRALERGDFALGLDHLDQMLRVEPGLIVGLYPVFEAIAAAPPALDALVERLALSPPWRERMLAMLLRKAPDAAAIAPLFERLHRSGYLQPDERSGWVERLVRDRLWGPAYLTWVKTLPAERQVAIGNVYDGGFEGEPSGAGFDWRVERVPGALVEFAPTEGMGGKYALRVRFDHRRVPFEHVRQLLALPPGRYRLEGRVSLDALQSERGLVWTITCAEGRKLLADTAPMSGNRRAWAPFGVDFEVPASRCGGQWLTLRVPARIPAEQRIGGVAWFDDLKVRRVAAGGR